MGFSKCEGEILDSKTSVPCGGELGVPFILEAAVRSVCSSHRDVSTHPRPCHHIAAHTMSEVSAPLLVSSFHYLNVKNNDNPLKKNVVPPSTGQLFSCNILRASESK